MSEFNKNLEIMNLLQEGSRRKKEADEKEEVKEVKSAPIEISESNPDQPMVGLNGIMMSPDGTLSKTRYFEMLSIDEDRYRDIQFTEEEARKISATLRHMSTGINASVPIICGGDACPFASSCPYIEINKAPIGRQCHPPGTEVLTSNRGYVNIENLDSKSDLVVNYGASPDGGGARKVKWRGSSFKLGSRYYSGELIKISAEDYSHECTDNHICFAKFNKSAKDKFIVYLMQKGDYFRIGKTSLFRVSAKGKIHSGLLGRVRKEEADKAWILGYYNSNSEALLAEEYYSCKWGIPKACFKNTVNNSTKWDGLYKWVTQEELNNHFNQFVKPICEYDKMLRTIGLRYEFPFVDRTNEGRAKHFSLSKAFEINACNLHSDIMDVMIVDNEEDSRRVDSIPRFAKLSLSRRYYEGNVYSMDVDKHPTYIANKIITHNCLVEKQLITFWTEQFIEEFDIDVNNFTEVHMAGELAECNILEMRVTKHLAEKHPTLIQESVTSVTQMGDEIVNDDIARAFEVKERIKSRRMKILESLAATRKEKAKLNVEKNEQTSTANQLSEIKKKLEEFKKNVADMESIEGEIIED